MCKMFLRFGLLFFFLELFSYSVFLTIIKKGKNISNHRFSCCCYLTRGKLVFKCLESCLLLYFQSKLPIGQSPNAFPNKQMSVFEAPEACSSSYN